MPFFGYFKEMERRLKNDIAQSLAFLKKEERLALYRNLGAEWVSNIFSYIEEPQPYIRELGVDQLAKVINEMDSDDAVDLLEDIDENVKAKLRPILDEDVKADIRLIHSYEEDEIGSLITTVNDLVAVVTYYGLAWLLLVECLHFA